MVIQHFKLNEEGLNHFFGPLEARIMEVIWNTSEITIREVQDVLSRDYPISFNAVMTVMNRLVEKGHLQKRLKGRSYLYRATQSKEEFLREQTKGMTRQLIREFGDLVVSHLVEALEEADPKLISELETKLKRLKKKN